ncbi:MAG TPA: hypothetical protein VHX63_17670 [Acidobacteriaceae bacterium]|nr:hypothetical protein [Acidobacteriaceae bacterium]
MTDLDHVIHDDHARPSEDALEPDAEGKNPADRRLEELANKSAQRSSDRIKKNETGKGVVPASDGH